MKQFFWLTVLLGLLAACTATSKQTESVVPGEVEDVAQIAAQTVDEQTLADETTAPEPISAQVPTAQTAPAAATKPATTSPAKTAAAATPAAPTVAASAAPETPAQNTQEPSRVSLARQQQPLAFPVPDAAQFKGEELISLSGRQISPLAYRPFSNAVQTAPWRGEQLKFGVYYSFVKAGTAYIKNRGLVEFDGRQAYLVQTSAFSAAAIDTVFKVRDINYSWIDATDFYSIGYCQSLREGNYKRDEWVIFDYPNQSYYGEIKKKGEAREISGSVTQQVLDILSALYYVRTRPLEPGTQVVFDILNREEQYPLVVNVLRRETVKTSAGKFKTIVVEPQFRGEGIFVSKGKSLQVWLTDDAYKMPVKMKTEVFIGSVSAELLEYKRN